MGCAIHVCLEVKLFSDSNKWEYVFSPFIWRNYQLFALLANVRNYDPDYDPGSLYNIEPISQPRGLPADITPETRTLLSSPDYHSFSWISQEEFKFYFPVHAACYNSDFIYAGHYAIEYANGGVMRVVFAFDN